MCITYSNEKRMIMRSPITDPDGNIFLFQLLWKGTTELCHLKMSPAVALHISSLIVHDHATHRSHPQIPPYPVFKCSGNCWTRNFAQFRSRLISLSGLKIVWEISHEFETRNIPCRKKFPPRSRPPPPPPPAPICTLNFCFKDNPQPQQSGQQWCIVGDTLIYLQVSMIK